MRGQVISHSSGCELDSDSWEETLILSGKIDDLIDPECDGSAKWSASSRCEIVLQEQCNDDYESTSSVIIESADSFRSFIVLSDNGCEAEAVLTATRARSDDETEVETPEAPDRRPRECTGCSGNFELLPSPLPGESNGQPYCGKRTDPCRSRYLEGGGGCILLVSDCKR